MGIRKILLGVGACAVLIGATAVAFEAAGQEVLTSPTWAYAIQLGPPAPPIVEDGKIYSLPGSGKSFIRSKIRSVDPKDPGVADWYPDEHPPMPKVVSTGEEGPGTRGIRPCGLCHYPNGKGRSENASVAGQPHDYIVATLHDMKSGVRQSSEPRKINAFQMDDYAKAMTEDEINQAATYFSSMAWTPWIKVVESPTAPKVRSAAGLYIRLDGVEAGNEPIGHRIVEVADNGEATEVIRDPHSGFTAYVPPGAIAKGKTLVTTGGGKTTACATCHGGNLSGVGSIPSIAARSPSYMARQLADMQHGTRHGAMASLMAPVVAQLTEDDIINITAYLASLPPGKPAV
jgi:cytochrome c553